MHMGRGLFVSRLPKTDCKPFAGFVDLEMRMLPGLDVPVDGKTTSSVVPLT